MDINELKWLWKKQEVVIQSNQIRNQTEIKSLLSKKSTDTIGAIKKTLLYKSFLMGFAGIIALILSFIHLFALSNESLILEDFITPIEAGVIFLLIGFIVIGIAIVNTRYYKQIDRINYVSNQLKKALNDAATIIQKTMNLSIYSDTVTAPAIFGFLAYIWIYQRDSFALDQRLIYLVLSIITISILSYVVSRWFENRKYSDNLKRLKGYLNELEEL